MFVFFQEGGGGVVFLANVQGYGNIPACLVHSGLGGNVAHSPAHRFLSFPELGKNFLPCAQYQQKTHRSTSYIAHKLAPDINVYSFVHVNFFILW